MSESKSVKLSRKAVEGRLAEARATLEVMRRNLGKPPVPPGTAETQDYARGRLTVYEREVARCEAQLAEAGA